MTHSRACSPADFAVAAAALADDLFAGAAARDAAAVLPAAGIALLHAADLMMAPFPVRPGGAGLVEPAAVDGPCHVLRAIGGADLSVGRLYEGHVNAVALVRRYGTPAQLETFVSEVLHCLSRDDLAALARRCLAALEPEGEMVLCH